MDILDYPAAFAISAAVAIAGAYLTNIWIYRNIYDKKIKATRQFLSQLQEFEKE